MVRSLLVATCLLFLLGGVVALANDSTSTTQTCADALQNGPIHLALKICRQEHQQQPDSLQTMRLLARAEFSDGDAGPAVLLWRTLLKQEGWSAELAHELAMALWRAGKVDEAEAQLRDALARNPTSAAYEDLISFLMGFSRWQDAVEVARAAAEQLPQVCSFFESWGIAEAGLGHDEKAVSLIEKAQQLGCPAFHWAWRGTIQRRLETQPVYQRLLKPSSLVAGLDQLNDDAMLRRLRLLRLTMTAEIAPSLVPLLRSRKEPELSFAALGLLMQVGAEAMPVWQELLSSKDFVLRKRTLRRIQELADPSFLPLLLQHLEQEELPGNRYLTKLSAGNLLLQGNEPWRGKKLLESIPEDSYLFPVANARLAEWAEKSGQPALAIDYLRRAKAADPNFPLSESRVQKLREQAQQAEPASAGK